MSFDDTNLELLRLIWVDKWADATQENREIQDKLRSIINYLRIFDNCQECENFILNKINDQEDNIILIVSGQFAEDIIEKIHHLKQIISIFIFCGNKQKYQSLTKYYKKIKNIIVQIDDLLKEIEIDKKSDEQKLNYPIKIYDNKDEFLKYILYIDYTIIDKNNLLNICFKQYEGNEKILELIEEFEHLYLSSNVFNYFFQETFLYNLLNKSFQTFNIQMIFLLRFFIQDIEKQLNNSLNSFEKCYYPKLMTIDQIDYLNQSNDNETILRFNTFIIAKLNEQETLNILENSSNTNGLHKVLFEIQENNIAKIYNEFIIFPITSQFKIISINFKKRIWFIKINIFNRNQFYLNRKIKTIELAHHLRQIQEYDQSEKLFNLLLNQYPLLNNECYDGLAHIAQDKCLYENSLYYYLKSLKNISKEYRGYCLNNIACIYDYLKQYDKAFEFYFQSLKYMNNQLNKSISLNNIGITYANIQDYNKAIQYFQDSLFIRQKYLKENHNDIAISYQNIGQTYLSIKQYDKALEYFNYAFKSFQLNNLYKAILYQNMANLFQEQKQFNKARQYYQDSLEIFQKLRSSDHPNIIYIQQQIQQLK